MSQLNHTALKNTLHSLNYKPEQINKSLELLVNDKSSIPFVSRYRKEATGGLDDVALIAILDTYNDFVTLEERRGFVLESIKKQEKLTLELEKKILSAKTLNHLEDLYAPFKHKQKTKAQIAIEKGLKPLADIIKISTLNIKQIEQKHTAEFVNSKNKLNSFEEAILGAQDILIEEIANHTEIKEKLRHDYWEQATIKSKVRKNADQVEDHLKFKDYFDFEQNIKTLKDKKNNFRFLALKRGLNEKILSLEITFDSKIAEILIKKMIYPNLDKLGCSDIIKSCITKAYSSYIHKSLENEIMSELKNFGEDSAIQIFGENLKNLLLQPYVGQKAILGIDPGVRTGCKVVAIDKNGSYLYDTVIYPHPPQNDIKGSIATINKFITQFNISYIAIGSGTYGRETLQILQEHIPDIKSQKIKTVLVNEDGASIYSASEIAREEFPDKDVTVRGAISIARRFQDPLAELVKIDPKSIGVGQYQHDVNPVKIKRSLNQVVESCVNHVGVDINTASASILSYISGIGPGLAKNIITLRTKLGGFKNRKELLKVSRFSDKVFEQSAGFLRIHEGQNPLDATFIHPEIYPILEKWAVKNKISLKDLPQNHKNIELLTNDQELKKEVGSYTHADIVNALKAKTQDPRTEFTPFNYRNDIKEITDLKVGQTYPGIVTNITQFGAFIDIGIKENGLIHISQMSDTFVTDPLSILKIGDNVSPHLIEIDIPRKRISLSLKSKSSSQLNDTRNQQPKINSKHSGRSNQNNQKTSDLDPNNPFAALKKLKI